MMVVFCVDRFAYNHGLHNKPLSSSSLVPADARAALVTHMHRAAWARRDDVARDSKAGSSACAASQVHGQSIDTIAAVIGIHQHRRTA